MRKNRVLRLNSLLKEVLHEVIAREVRDPRLAPLMTVTEVDISPDLHHAKVSISVIGSDKQKQDTLQALQSAADFISILAAKKVVLRYFPTLTFKLDHTVDEHMRIGALLEQIHAEQRTRTSGHSDDSCAH